MSAIAFILIALQTPPQIEGYTAFKIRYKSAIVQIAAGQYIFICAYNKRGGRTLIPLSDFLYIKKLPKCLRKVRKLTNKEKIRAALRYTKFLPSIPEKVDFWRYPSETARVGGDCEDKAFLLYALLRLLNVDAYVMLGLTNGLEHAWVVCDGKVLDSTKYGSFSTPLYEPIVKVSHKEEMFIQ